MNKCIIESSIGVIRDDFIKIESMVPFSRQQIRLNKKLFLQANSFLFFFVSCYCFFDQIMRNVLMTKRTEKSYCFILGYVFYTGVILEWVMN
ncbi:hypothetical protein AX774_g545 [Zancudomyces culisetae]|uniref:Uncharacterized protein n=1 Tax=Zancudomyces culisetae TaxID=1213189 RepID=A0A1R1PY71_ZANCU|nr:hypothetical protein AX774_g545 [Zancudomyces culisetae]|eukprot:OMH85900.1 hypothetical protein AX774_g545 [Zancudomyces culisetae]